MSTGLKFVKFIGTIVLCTGVLCLGSLSLADTASTPSRHKTKKSVPPPPPLPSGPTGPVPQVPLDSIKPVPPQVSYQNGQLNGQLTIVAPNSTLGDILRAVRKQTGAEIEIPDAQDRVVTHLGPGTARDVVAELLNGSRFNYVLLGSPEDASLLTRVVLVAKAGADKPATPPGQPVAEDPNGAQPPQEVAQDMNDADAPEEAADDSNNDQQAAEEQPVATPDPPGVKTPQQMLQEMQQRQLQLQQQQQEPVRLQPSPGPLQPPPPPSPPQDQ